MQKLLQFYGIVNGTRKKLSQLILMNSDTNTDPSLIAFLHFLTCFLESHGLKIRNCYVSKAFFFLRNQYFFCHTNYLHWIGDTSQLFWTAHAIILLFELLAMLYKSLQHWVLKRRQWAPSNLWSSSLIWYCMCESVHSSLLLLNL